MIGGGVAANALLRWSQHNDTVYAFSAHPANVYFERKCASFGRRCVVVCVVVCILILKGYYASSSSSFFSSSFGMIPSSTSLFAFSSAGVGAIIPQEVENPFERPSFARWLSTALLVTVTFDDFIAHFLTSIHRSSSMTKVLRHRVKLFRVTDCFGSNSRRSLQVPITMLRGLAHVVCGIGSAADS